MTALFAPPTDADYLARLSDAELELIGRDRAWRWQGLVDDGQYDAAALVQPSVAAVNREVERRMEIIAAQGRAMRAFIDAVWEAPKPDGEKDWGLAHDDFVQP